MIDPRANLAAVPYLPGRNPWILPAGEERLSGFGLRHGKGKAGDRPDSVPGNGAPAPGQIPESLSSSSRMESTSTRS